MRCTAAGLLAGLRALALLGLMALAALPAAGQGVQPRTVALGDANPRLDAEALGLGWVDTGGAATIEQVSGGGPAVRFAPQRGDVIYSLGDSSALWLHYRLMRGLGDRQGWLIEFPMPLLDSVTVYQQDAGGKWRAQAAGDLMAVSRWAEAGRYPYFRLDLPPGQPHDVFVRIRNLTSANFPVRLVTESAHDQHIQIEYLGLGVAFGALVLLISACLAQSWVYRDRAYAWYALYATVTTLAVAAYTGVTAHLLWPDFGALEDAPVGCLAAMAAGAALLFVRNLIGIPARLQVMDRLVQAYGMAGIVLAAVYPVLARSTALAILSVYVVSATVVVLVIAAAAWRRQDVVGRWVLLAYLPLTLSVTMSVMRLFGWLPVFFGTQYSVVVAMAFEVPLLLVALSIRSRERHGAQIRELALSSQDALTGLLAPHLFHDRLRQVVARYKRDKENAAVVFIDLVNYPRIKDYYGSAVAEQSLLRSVIKLRRLLRDVDTVSRIGEARFGLILEGVGSRVAVTDRAARLIAAGLMPLKGLKPDVTLQFHTAAVLLDERMMEAPDLVDALSALLSSMSSRTRRPIRFLEPEVTQPAPLDPDSMHPAEEDSMLPRPDGPAPSLSRMSS
ncbi:MAG: diguanylate cyclase [Burkholderiales bacterium]|nr:diguanylate cyclase [Burkholderiales bacterium]